MLEAKEGTKYNHYHGPFWSSGPGVVPHLGNNTFTIVGINVKVQNSESNGPPPPRYFGS